jgi:hypothetical protein
VVLIVEDDSDGRALESLARASRLPVRIDWLPANGIGNIKRRAEALIRLAMDRIEHHRGCVAVVVDRDHKDRERDEPHRTINEACAAKATPFIEVVEALEAWLLADDGVMSWLGLKARRQTDGISNPKKIVARAFLKKTKRSYQKRRSRMQLAAKATGVKPERSASWSQALAHLERCPVEEGDAR